MRLGRGLRSRSPVRLIRSYPFCAPGVPGGKEKSKHFLKVLAHPLTNATENPVAGDACRARRFGPFRHREKQQPGGGRKGGAVGRLGQSENTRRPADANLLVE